MLRLIQQSAHPLGLVRCLSTRLQVTFHVKLIEDKYTTNEYDVSSHVGTSILAVLNDNDIGIHSFCGGHCKCGACIIRLPKELDSKRPRSDDEIERLKAVHADEPCLHLACQTTVGKDMEGKTIEINYNDDFLVCSSP